MIKRFGSIYKFCDGDINKFTLISRKSLCPYEYMDDWEALREKFFYSSMNMEDITHADHRHAKRVFKDFNNKNPADYRNLYVQSDTLLLADVFENKH